MPAATHTEPLKCVNDAILDSLASNSTNSNHYHHHHHHHRNNKNNSTNNSSSNVKNIFNSEEDSYDSCDEFNPKSIENKLYASSENILNSKIEYEEVNNYSNSILDELKSKYLVLRSLPLSKHSSCNSSNNQHNTNNIKHKNITNTKTSTGDGDDNGDTANDNNNQDSITTIEEEITNHNNSSQIPEPKYVLYSEKNILLGWNNSPNGHKWVIGSGLLNVGNSCYLNATLQALFHIPSLANWLVSDSVHRNHCIKSGNFDCTICGVARTLLLTQKEKQAVQPFGVFTRLKYICRHLLYGKQEDAHEFLRFLIESMEECFLLRFSNHKILDEYSKRTTPLNHIFGGYIKSVVRCLSCNYESVTYQYFQDIILDIRKADNIEDALDAYFSCETLEDTSYNCDSCKMKVSATKQFFIEKIPFVLCIQMKRFSGLVSKITKQVKLKEYINLTKYLSQVFHIDLKYRLVSAIVHLGFSQCYGHYTAIAATPSGLYYSFDDSFVEQIYVSDVCNSRPYMIFYELDQSSNIMNKKLKASPTMNRKTNNDLRTSSESVSKSSRPGEIIGPQLPEKELLDNNKNHEFVKKPTNSNTLNGSGSVSLRKEKSSFSKSENCLDNSKLSFQASTSKNVTIVNYEVNHTATVTTTSCIKNSANSSLVNINSTTSTFHLDNSNNFHKNVQMNGNGIENGNKVMAEGNNNDDTICESNYQNNYNCNINVQKTNINGNIKMLNSQTKKMKLLVLYTDDETDDESADDISTSYVNLDLDRNDKNGVNIHNKKRNNKSTPGKYDLIDAATSKYANLNSKNKKIFIEQRTCDSNLDKNKSSYKPKRSLWTQNQRDGSEKKDVFEDESESEDKSKRRNTGQNQLNSMKDPESNSTSFELWENKDNSNNPFAKNTQNNSYPRTIKRTYKNANISDVGTSNSTSNGKVGTGLGKQSHRGYGAPISNWTGKQSNVDKEIINELETKALNDEEYAYNNEMDGGAKKKIKLNKGPYRSERSQFQHNSNYNQFQEKQNRNLHSKNYNRSYKRNYKYPVQWKYRNNRRPIYNNSSANYRDFNHKKNNSFRNRSDSHEQSTSFHRIPSNNHSRYKLKKYSNSSINASADSIDTDTYNNYSRKF